MALGCLWVQFGVNNGDIHVTQSGYEVKFVDKARQAVCRSCGTEIARHVAGQWFFRIRMRRGGDRYQTIAPPFVVKYGLPTDEDSGDVVAS